MPKKTAQTIVESGNEYVLQVKGNQPTLLNAVKEVINTQSPIDIDYTLEMNRGRKEERQVFVYDRGSSPVFDQWSQLKKVIMVVSRGKRANKKYEEKRYYITNKSEKNAQTYNIGIRSHWGIENKLHWVKDKILNEDEGLMKDYNRAGIQSLIRNIIINLYRINGYKSLTWAIEKFTNNIKGCLNIINKKHILIN